MPRLIAIRLLPEHPVSAEAFTGYLADLSIEVFDASFADPGAKEPASQLGTAAYIAPTTPLPPPPTDEEPIHDPDTRIVQHYELVELEPVSAAAPPTTTLVMFSVATALIEVPAGVPAAEHNTVDLRITLQRAGATIQHKRRYFNVPMRPGGLPGDPGEYPDLTLEGQPFVSLYLYLPAPGLETGGELKVPEDGTAPNFNELRTKVVEVLDADPGNTDDIADLKPILARHVANEIVWGHSEHALPAPDAPLEILYTEPASSGDSAERARTSFEGDLKTHQVGNDAIAERLANFVFTLSAALRIEAELASAPFGDAAVLNVPIDPADVGGATARIRLTGLAASAPFAVPAAYVYALTATLPLQVTAEQRRKMVLFGSEETTVPTLEEALHNGIVDDAGLITIHQAARRLIALGKARETGLPECPVAGPPEVDLVDGWLAASGPDIAAFWSSMTAAQADGHFALVLCAVTDDHQDLIMALTSAPLSISSVAGLRALPDGEWAALFAGNPALLPPFTHPGSVSEQTQTFLRHLRRFFDAAVALAAPDPAAPGTLPLLDPPVDDLLAALGADVEAFDPVADAAAVDALFPDDPEGREAFLGWLSCLQSVLALTVGIAPEPLRFSVAEALWARGFVRPADLDGLDLATFSGALIGTVAHEHAATILANAEAEGAEPLDPVGPFAPVNPWGALANCIPPKHLSPLGPVAYLQELLQVTDAATCDDPLAAGTTLAAALAARRGPLADLVASHSNACIPIPVIDIVKEALEHVVAAGALPGAVLDSNRDEVGGHVLSTNPTPPGGATVHDAQTLFCALPEHSTPATPTAEQSAWDILAEDFTACVLPYNQPLDVARSTLNTLRTSRLATMRGFTREIHAFVHGLTTPPAEFRSHLWRLPVTQPLALEFVGISQEEFDVLYSPGELGPVTLPSHYGFPTSPGVDPDAWMDEVRILSMFLQRNCLSYCEFRELVLSGFVTILVRHRREEVLPECEPCCLEEHIIEFPEDLDLFGPLKRLSVFIRLWRSLDRAPHTRLSFAELADAASVLTLFNGNTVNAGFIPQLAAFLMLRRDLSLRLTDPEDPPSATATGAARTHLLAFWSPGAAKFDWAVGHLLNQIQQYAMRVYRCPCRLPVFLKLLRRNLDPLSRFAGFDPDTPGLEWHARPTSLQRIVEFFVKLYASKFGVGELFFLFTADPRLQGDDPFPAQSPNEALDLPFDLPDNEAENSLFALRDSLLAVEAEPEGWSWARIGETLRTTYGLPDGDPRWAELGERFFPDLLESEGTPVPPADRAWREPLASAATSEPMWNTPEGPFRYLAASQELEAALPLVDAAVIAKLARIRQLNAQERQAISDLYMAPRRLLAFFGFLFENHSEAEQALLEAPDEETRWDWFRRNFARFHARSLAIAEHLAGHLDRITGDVKPDGAETALLLLRHLWADENTATAPWEDDSGAAPGVLWGPRPNGGAFHAMHGVVGTGLIAEYRGAGPLIRWRETRGGLDAFGDAENAANAPLPVLIPAMTTTLTAEQLEHVAIRNGFAFGNTDATPVGGAEPFTLIWRGVLLIEQGGEYGFRAGAPRPGAEHPDFEELRRFHSWRVRLAQGQKEWVLLAHNRDEDAPADCAKPIHLKRGFYDVEIEFERLDLVLDGPEDVCPQTTGFQIKYDGPDAGGDWAVIANDKLFIGIGERMDDGLDTGISSPGVLGALGLRHVVSLRSMRRTLKRVVKAMLFAYRLDLGAIPITDSGQSELGYMLSQPAAFSGQTHFASGVGFQTHRADFDMNLLPVLDNYAPPTPAQDQRAGPSPQRMAAWGDCFERLFDYSVMRAATGTSPEPTALLLFNEAAEAHVDKPAQLLRHIGVNIRHVPLVLRYFDPTQATLTFDVTSPDLIDDRWAVRVWHADRWLQQLRAAFLEADIGAAEPHLWAAHPVEMPGLANLTKFHRDGCIENGDPRRYKEIERLNDGLRERGRDALVAFLTAMNRVALPWGGFATAARDLSDLLLLDVEAGLCQKAARVEEAITALQLFVDRARLGLEAGFTPGAGFAMTWDRKFAGFRTWQACKRREIYRENWIGWTAEAVAQGSEAMRFLQSELRRSDLTLAVPGGGVHWPSADLPPAQALTLLQKREPATQRRLDPPRQGIGLMGIPDRHARPSWLAPLGNGTRRPEDDEPDPIFLVTDPNGIAAAAQPSLATTGSGQALPMWFEAPVRLGAKFLRVAAAALPAASANYGPKCDRPAPSWCCQCCGRDHPPMIDEYYFWIDVTEVYLPVEQVAEWVSGTLFDEDGQLVDDVPVDSAERPVPDTVWHDETALPGALAWAPRRIARLNWSRVHNGEFQPPRRSSEGVLLTEVLDAGLPEIGFRGRQADSLFFDVDGGDPANPTQGFRYDIAPDTATPLPELQPAEVPELSGGLAAFPWFAFSCPGAPVLPKRTFGAVLAVAEHLAAHCRYEDALKWLELEFPPLQGDNIWAACDRPRLPDPTIPEDPDDPDDPDLPIPVPAVINPVLLPRPGICCCPSDPVSDTRAERRLVMMLYGEILLHWAEALIRKDTPEAYQRARLLADTARRILGAMPKTVVVKPGEAPALPVRDVTLACAPLNPRLMCLYEKAEDIEGRIHACLDSRRHKAGRPNAEQPYFSDDLARECWKLSGDPCLDAAQWCRRKSPHRFTVLVERARRMGGECAQLGRALQQAFQSGDAEFLSQLTTKHQRQINDLMLEIRQNQWRETDWAVQALRKSKEASITNLTYYQNLLAAGLLSGESQYEPLIGTATGLRAAGNVVEAIGQAMNLIPDPNVGFPCNFVTLPPGKKLAMIFSSIGTVVNVAADIVNTVASLGLTKDGWERREDEWRHQIDVVTIDVARNEREILAAERRRDAALRELNAHRASIANTAELHDFLRDKFTSHELFLWMQKELAALHAQCHELALVCALDAEAAFNFERELSTERFVALDAPDSLHERLLDGDRLGLALARMQKAYEDRDRRPYELTKHISLRQHFPTAFLQLVATGRCVVELPEWLFDLDYPGHYLRRIRSLAVSLPCVVGPYQGIQCKVTLLASSIRVSPEVRTADHRCCDDTGCNSGYEALPDDPRVAHLYGAAEAIATSSGQEDAGLFSLDLNDVRYLPFEYQGAVSRLCIELPPETNRFDLETLADLVLHMRYIAHEGGDLLRAAAWDCARRHLPGSGQRFIDAKREMPGRWRRMAAPGHHGMSREETDYLGLALDRAMFPFLTGNRRPVVGRIEILFEAPDADPSRPLRAIFFAGERVETIRPDTCREGVFTVDCVADAAWPGFFHGVLEIDPVELAGHDTAAGVLAFDPRALKICNAWLVFGYAATEPSPRCVAPPPELLPCP